MKPRARIYKDEREGCTLVHFESDLGIQIFEASTLKRLGILYAGGNSRDMHPNSQFEFKVGDTFEKVISRLEENGDFALFSKVFFAELPSEYSRLAPLHV